jgi:hypothetical protein
VPFGKREFNAARDRMRRAGDAVGILCAETTFRELPVGAIFVPNSTVSEVLRAWGTASMVPLLLKGRGERGKIEQETRVVVVRVIQRADKRAAGGRAR